MVKTIRGLQDFQTIVNDEPSLNKGSMSLVKLDTPENSTEPILGSKSPPKGGMVGLLNTIS